MNSLKYKVLKNSTKVPILRHTSYSGFEVFYVVIVHPCHHGLFSSVFNFNFVGVLEDLELFTIKYYVCDPVNNCVDMYL
jgi:hypothetical protein